MWWRSTLWVGAIFGTLLFVLPHILWIVSWIVGKLFHIRVHYALFGWCSLALILLVWGTLAYGHYVGRFRQKVSRVEYSSSDVPSAFDGFRVVHVSDLHVDSFDDRPQTLQNIVDKVNELEADVILFTGDVTTGSFSSIQKHEKSLQGFQAKEGVVSVLGNHDFFIYDRQYGTMAQRCEVADMLTEYERHTLGWKVLRNESVLLRRGEDSIAVAGVDNTHGRQGFHTIRKGDLGKAMAGLEGVFTILLTHDPGHWAAEVLPKSHAQITLSGHTHAAQVRLFGWSLAKLCFAECDGRYDRGNRMLYVNAGIGCTAPFRIGCPSEITLITLRNCPE